MATAKQNLQSLRDESPKGSWQTIVSCTNFRAVEAGPLLMHRFGVPVVTSNQATIDAAFDAIGVSAIAYEIDPALDRHEVDNGAVLRRERFNVSSAVPVRFSERVLCALGREQDARLGKRDPSPLVRWQC